MSQYNFQTSIAYLKGVGPSRADLLKKELGIKTFGDLINFFPHRYIDRTQFFKINQLQQNSAEIQIVGRVTSLKMVKQKKGSRLVGKFQDDTGTMELIWFRGAKWIKDSIKIILLMSFLVKLLVSIIHLRWHIQKWNWSVNIKRVYAL